MSSKDHWENVYNHKASDALSWYQAHADISLNLIESVDLSCNAPIIDVGGGSSTLVDDLLARHFTNLTVLDISANSLQTARQRVGKAPVKWVCADITRTTLPPDAYDLWHDRAVFHFLMQQQDRTAYKTTLLRSLRAGGFFIIATFAEDGPTECSALPVQRYSVEELEAEFGENLQLQSWEKESHETPTGTVQRFNYCLFRKPHGR